MRHGFTFVAPCMLRNVPPRQGCLFLDSCKRLMWATKCWFRRDFRSCPLSPTAYLLGSACYSHGMVDLIAAQNIVISELAFNFEHNNLVSASLSKYKRSQL